MTPVQLASELKVIVDQLFNLRPQWEGDQLIAELIDVRHLNGISSLLCSGDQLGCAACQYGYE